MNEICDMKTLILGRDHQKKFYYRTKFQYHSPYLKNDKKSQLIH